MSKKLLQIALVLLAVALVFGLTTRSVYADDWNKATKFTVNQPFEIGGVILQAGTYMVQIVDLAAERHAVRFSSEDQTKVFATVLAIPNYRMEATDDTAMTFYESEPGRPRALHEWFYPGHRNGVEFAYPAKSVAFEALAEEPVAVTKEVEELPVVREKPVPAVTEFFEEPTAEAPAETEIAAAPEPEPEPATEAASEPAPLPKTATPFPLLALVGLLAGGAASGVRWLRR